MKSLIVMAALTTVGAFAQPAAAQLSQNTKAPIDITADLLETHNTDCWRLPARPRPCRASRLRADLIAHLDSKGKPAGHTASASAGCGADQPGQGVAILRRRRACTATRLLRRGLTTITITGDVWRSGQASARDQWSTTPRRGNSRRGQRQGPKQNRPRGVFYPKQRRDDAGKPKKARSEAEPAGDLLVERFGGPPGRRRSGGGQHRQVFRGRPV
jgi:hypothetical protein